MLKDGELSTLQQKPRKRGKLLILSIVVAAVAILGLVAGMLVMQQENRRKETLETLLELISQTEFNQTSELYTSLDEKTLLFVQDEVKQQLENTGVKWICDQLQTFKSASSSEAFDKLRDLRTLATAVGVESMVPLADKALKLEEFASYVAFEELAPLGSDTANSIQDFNIAIQYSNYGLSSRSDLIQAAQRCADSYIAAAEKVAAAGLEKNRLQELYDFYNQAAQDYQLFVQGLAAGDAAIVDQALDALGNDMELHSAFINDAMQINQEQTIILEDMAAMMPTAVCEEKDGIPSDRLSEGDSVEG